ncbi:hypothetical protein R6Z07M_004015 [Ovis aries]
MDGGVWWAAVHGVAMSQTRLNIFTFTFHFHALEKCSCLENPRDMGGLVGCHLWGHTESDMTEATAAAAEGSCAEGESHSGPDVSVLNQDLPTTPHRPLHQL